MKKLYLLSIAVLCNFASIGQSYSDLINSIMGQNRNTVETILSGFEDYKMYYDSKFGIRVEGIWIILHTTFDYNLTYLIVQKDNRDVIPNMPEFQNKKVGTHWTDYIYIYKVINTLVTKDYDELIKIMMIE